MRLGGRDLIRLWAVPILLAGIALAFDAADRRVPFSVLASDPLDEVAHLATGALGLLALSCFIDAPRRFYVAGLIASVAIDLDHIPLDLGLGNTGQRPVTHSLTTVVVVVIAAAVSRRHRAVFVGAATGLLIHFARDVAEGPPGVRMLWPLQNTAWTASFRWFLGMIITFTVVRLVLAHGHSQVPVTCDDLGDVWRQAAHETGVGDEDPPEVVRGVVQGGRRRDR